jgi:hypothetical protein
MTNKAWDMLREQFTPDGKGRFKTTDAMEIAKQLAEENESLHKIIDAYAEGEGYIPLNVLDLWNQYHREWDVEHHIEYYRNSERKL